MQLHLVGPEVWYDGRRPRLNVYLGFWWVPQVKVQTIWPALAKATKGIATKKRRWRDVWKCAEIPDMQKE